MKKIGEDLLVITPQYKTVDLTYDMLESLKQDNIPFTSLVVCDGTPEAKRNFISNQADITIVLKESVHSLPELINMMFNMGKTIDSKYILYTNSDMVFKKGSLKSMMELIQQYDIVSPVKIDNDSEKYNIYKPIANEPIKIIGMNDTSFMMRIEKIDYNPIDRIYGPYQFEISAFAYDMWKKGYSSVVDPNAVIFHFCSRDIQYCPEERKDSANWDKKKEYFLNKNGDSGKWFVDNSLMNNDAVKQFGFPVYVEDKQ